MGQKIEKTSLKETASNIFGDSRIILPGIQALFGFQLVSVFSPMFNTLDQFEKNIHFLATLMIACATICAMTPAVHDRLTDPEIISESFIQTTTNFLRLALVLFMIGIVLDLYFIGLATIKNSTTSLIVAIVFLFINAMLWFYPRFRNVKE